MKLNRITISALAVILGVSCFAVAQEYRRFQGHGSSQYGQSHGGWDAPPEEFRDIQRQGFRDGIEGARKDFDNHRRPDVNNRDEYRHPRVSTSARQDYREEFRHGYDRAMAHLMEERGPR